MHPKSPVGEPEEIKSYNMKSFKAILFLLLSFTFCQTRAQKYNGYTDRDYGQFVKLFSRTNSYTTDQSKEKRPTACLIKVETNSEKQVTSMQLSDSADSTFSAQFNKYKSSLDTQLLNKYLKSNYANDNCNIYIIPISFAMFRSEVPNQSIALNSFYGYSKFKGEFLTGKLIFLEPIYSESSIPVR
jgi:hypothetical protein